MKKGRFDWIKFDGQAETEQNRLRQEFRGLEKMLREYPDQLAGMQLPEDEYYPLGLKMIELLRDESIPKITIIECLYFMRGRRIRRDCQERTGQ